MIITKKNYKKIKIDGTCPRCGSCVRLIWWAFTGNHSNHYFIPTCTNSNCEESDFCGSIKIRFVNHRRAKVVGIYE